MISDNKIRILSRIKDLRLERVKINNELKGLKNELRNENIYNMTHKQRRSLSIARKALLEKKNRIVSKKSPEKS